MLSGNHWAEVCRGFGMGQVSEDRLRSAWLSTEVALVATVAFFVLQRPFERVLERHGGHGIVDLELAGPGAPQIVRDWRDAGVAAAQSQLIVDFFFIVAYVAVICYAARLVALTFRPALVRQLYWLVGLAAVVAGLCDVVENVLLLNILDNKEWPQWWADAARTAALIKFWLVAAVAFIALIGVLAAIASRTGRQSWGPAHAEILRWLKGADHEIVPAPGRPPNTSPKPKPELTASAISCSGGGIRSASFCLGGLQALTKAGIYQKADYITAVSGGSYIAASYAMVRGYSGAAGGNTLLTEELPAYAPGSPEEIRLRNHTRYLLPDPRVAAIGLFGVMYGLLLNLGALLVGVFVMARILGWVLHEWHVLRGFTTAHASVAFPDRLWLGIGGLFVAGVAAYVLLDRVRDVYFPPRLGWLGAVRAWSLRLLVAGLAATILLVAAPLAVTGLYNLATSNSPNVAVARLITAVGFTTEKGCEAAAEARGARGACGEEAKAPTQAAGQAAAQVEGDSKGFQATGLVGLLAALIGVIRLIVGRLKPKETGESKESKPSFVTKIVDRVRAALLPWLGSAIAAALIVVLYLRWLQDAALTGATPRQVWTVALAIAGFAVLKLFTDVNRNSIHPYYRERLASAFAVQRTREGTAEPPPYKDPARLSRLYEPHGPGRPDSGPKLIVCAAANVDDQGLVPPGRNAVSFTFSHDTTGVSTGIEPDGGPGALRQVPTRDFENYAGPRLLTLTAAVAVSGAAVSPVMGRQTRPSVRFLLGMANVRLGLWLPNPERVPASAEEPRQRFLEKPWWKFWQKFTWQWRQPGPGSLVLELLGRNSIKRRWLYVTDGGHYENLGLVEALRRRPKVVFAFDASGDRPNNWGTLGEAVSVARADLGVEIDIDPTVMQSDGDRLVEVAVARGTYTYADGATGTLWLAKLGVPKTAPWDVRSYTRRDPAFPGKSTAQQLYGDLEFEAYRKLGVLAGEHIVQRKHGPVTGNN